MTAVRVLPGVAHGRLLAPPSKSYTHRALVVGHLSGRRFVVERPLDSDDTRATARALGVLGSLVTRRSRAWTVTPARRRPSRRTGTIDCGESGTTLRFVAALAALSDRPTRLVGRGRLAERPMRPLLEALTALGARCVEASPDRGLPLTITGPIRGGSVRLDASESSQFASALLLALPRAEGDSVIRLTGPIVSEPYLEATRAVVRAHGIALGGDRRSIGIRGRQRYRGHRFRVPGDASSAAYLWSAAALTGGRVRVDGIPPRWPQADRSVLDVLERAGARVTRGRDSATVAGPVDRPFVVELTSAPDLYPLAGVLAAAVPGTSELRGARHIALKESDRRAGTERLVRALGARCRSTRAGLAIEGTDRIRPVRLLNLTDHRMVMSAAVGALAAEGPSTIGDARAVAKSFPRFFSVLRSLSGGRTAR
ncbi:MAG TPA: 3-phosphoshikimate 1-carboxyvinyltransferase [Thermoplasmata archaeon]|nr:3-phosphoshikimate 1-carboxyvinyltransferase [Thermoplasmata archaeon]